MGQPGSDHLPDSLLDRGQNALRCTKEKEIQVWMEKNPHRRLYLHASSNTWVENSLSCLFGPRKRRPKKMVEKCRNGLKVHHHPLSYRFLHLARPTVPASNQNTKKSIGLTLPESNNTIQYTSQLQTTMLVTREKGLLYTNEVHPHITQIMWRPKRAIA